MKIAVKGVAIEPYAVTPTLRFCLSIEAAGRVSALSLLCQVMMETLQALQKFKALGRKV